MTDWQQRVDDVWASADELGELEVVRQIDELAAELAVDDPRGPFETGGARDSAGLEAEAEHQYRRALELGLSGRPRVECLIQLASTVRNLGRPHEALSLLLEAERDPHDLGDAISAFRALALVDAGDARRAASVAVAALAGHLPQYARAARAYTAELLGE
ncbi:tetratricopeptide repeat protein [Agromyces protaetiae]|uniref:Tetratricopeptide repeat protein n=1 Tax=Agromyces protaetiae TaxID=2509455 RepID=A0A4P6FTI2_9MICO|nr:tetratricopeptide repeat protein [Agromyces protaetiae]QAY73868.1 tetratricopeptide repeat protein [Agromyces protaetiae]